MGIAQRDIGSRYVSIVKPEPGEIPDVLGRNTHRACQRPCRLGIRCHCNQQVSLSLRLYCSLQHRCNGSSGDITIFLIRRINRRGDQGDVLHGDVASQESDIAG